MAMEIDPEDAQRVAEAVERISYVVELIERRIATVLDDVKDIDKTVQDTAKQADKGAESAKKKIYGVKQEVDRIFEQVKKQDLTRIVFGPFDRKLEEAKVRLARWQTEIQRQFEARGALLGGADKMLGMSAAGGGIKSLIGQLTQGMPLGGLLGFVMWGGLKNEVYDSAARRAVYHLRAIGQTGKEQVGALSGQMRRFYSEFGDEGLQMLDASVKAFTDFGETGKEQASVAAEGFGSSIRDVSLALDAMTGSAWGTNAKLIGETMQATSTSVEDASDQILEMNARLLRLGLNFGVYSAGITQATASLRLHNQSSRDSVKIFSTLYEQLQKQGFGKQRAGQMALERMQGAATGVMGMPEGLQALLAQDFAKKGMQGFAGMKDPFALLTRFRLGQEQGGEGKDLAFMSEAFKGLRERAYDIVGPEGTPEERKMRAVGALARLGTMDEKSAVAIIDSAGSAEDTKNILGMMKPAAEETKDLLKSLNGAFAAYSGRQSEFEKGIRKLTEDLASIASALLGIVTQGFRNLYNLARALPALLTPAALRSKEENEVVNAFGVAMAEGSKQNDAHIATITNKIGGMGDHVKALITPFFKSSESVNKAQERLNKAFGGVKSDEQLDAENGARTDKENKDRIDAINKNERLNVPPGLPLPVPTSRPKPKGKKHALHTIKDAGTILASAAEELLKQDEAGRRLQGSEPMTG